MKTIVQKVKFKATPQELFDLYMDSKKHSEATGGKAVLSKNAGGSFLAWDGYIEGKNLVLVPGRLIVQAWRTSEFKKSDLDSVLVLTLEKAVGGSLLTMTHTAVPDAIAPHFNKGWKTHYWKPFEKYLKTRKNK